MAVYAVFTYDIVDPDRFAQYIPGSAGAVLGAIAAQGGELIFADGEAAYVSGEARTMTVCIKFPNAEAVHAFENDPNYAEAKAHREASTANATGFIAKEFTPPQPS